MEKQLNSDSRSNRNLQQYRGSCAFLRGARLVVPTEEIKQSNSVRIPTLADGHRQIVVAFTSESSFRMWSRGRYNSEVVEAGDLLCLLPDDVWLIINPATTHPLELSPAEINSSIEQATVKADQAIRSIESARKALTEKKANAQNFLLEDLRQVLKNYREIQSASIMFREEIFVKALISLDSDRLSTKRRMLLFSEIADVSRTHFDLAGALEIIDAEEKRRWVEFHRKSFDSFYQRRDRDGWTIGQEAFLSDKLDVQAIKSKQKGHLFQNAYATILRRLSAKFK